MQICFQEFNLYNKAIFLGRLYHPDMFASPKTKITKNIEMMYGLHSIAEPKKCFIAELNLFYNWWI